MAKHQEHPDGFAKPAAPPQSYSENECPVPNYIWAAHRSVNYSIPTQSQSSANLSTEAAPPSKLVFPNTHTICCPGSIRSVRDPTRPYRTSCAGEGGNRRTTSEVIQYYPSAVLLLQITEGQVCRWQHYAAPPDATVHPAPLIGSSSHLLPSNGQELLWPRPPHI